MKKKCLLSTLILFLSVGALFAQENKITALYIINFAKYVGWPSAGGDFVITVLGDDPIFDQLKSLGAETKIGDKTIVVKKVMFVEKAGACNILYISPDKSSTLPTAIAQFSQTNTLIVTNKSGLAKEGSAINLVTLDGKLTFEINVESLKKSGLTAKPALFKLGKTVSMLWIYTIGQKLS